MGSGQGKTQRSKSATPGRSTVVNVTKDWRPGIDVRITTVRDIGSPQKLGEINITRIVELIIDKQKHPPQPVEPYKYEVTYIGGENEVPAFLSNASTGRTRHDSKPWEDNLHQEFIELASADAKEFKELLEEEHATARMRRIVENRPEPDQITF